MPIDAHHIEQEWITDKLPAAIEHASNDIETGLNEDRNRGKM